MKFNDHRKRGFFNFADGSNGYNSYLADCCAVGRVSIGLIACNSGGIVLVSTMPLGHDWPRGFLYELGLLASEHGALDGTKIDQFSIIEFETIKAAKRFAFVLVDWLENRENLEHSPSELDDNQFVQLPENHNGGTNH